MGLQYMSFTIYFIKHLSVWVPIMRLNSYDIAEHKNVKLVMINHYSERGVTKCLQW